MYPAASALEATSNMLAAKAAASNTRMKTRFEASSRERPAAMHVPNTVPMVVNRRDCFKTNPVTVRVVAPKATRIPISFVLCVTK